MLSKTAFKSEGLSPILSEVTPYCVLAVEDEHLSMEFLKSQIQDMGVNLLTAENGQDALKILNEAHEKIDVILMDREMPIMDGLTAVKRIKKDSTLRKIPVIMITSADDPSEIKEGLDAGVFYYLTKPVDEKMLSSVLSAAMREVEQTEVLADELGKHKSSFNLIEKAKFKFQTLEEAESLAAFVANFFPDPERALPGLGALMINAIEHGNLGVGYDRKTELIELNTWRSEIERLQKLPENKDKHATAIIGRNENGAYVSIEDQGPGFEWQRFIQIDPSRAGDNHGRGIAQTRSLSFDRLVYNDAGNQVIALSEKEKDIEW